MTAASRLVGAIGAGCWLRARSRCAQQRRLPGAGGRRACSVLPVHDSRARRHAPAVPIPCCSPHGPTRADALTSDEMVGDRSPAASPASRAGANAPTGVDIAAHEDRVLATRSSKLASRCTSGWSGICPRYAPRWRRSCHCSSIARSAAGSRGAVGGDHGLQRAPAACRAGVLMGSRSRVPPSPALRGGAEGKPRAPLAGQPPPSALRAVSLPRHPPLPAGYGDGREEGNTRSRPLARHLQNRYFERDNLEPPSWCWPPPAAGWCRTPADDRKAALLLSYVPVLSQGRRAPGGRTGAAALDPFVARGVPVVWAGARAAILASRRVPALCRMLARGRSPGRRCWS